MICCASRCAEQSFDAHRNITIGAKDIFVASRYLPFGEMRGQLCRYACACGDCDVQGSSGASHDDSLNTRLCKLHCIYFVKTCLFDKYATISCSV